MSAPTQPVHVGLDHQAAGEAVQVAGQEVDGKAVDEAGRRR